MCTRRGKKDLKRSVERTIGAGMGKGNLGIMGSSSSQEFRGVQRVKNCQSPAIDYCIGVYTLK